MKIQFHLGIWFVNAKGFYLLPVMLNAKSRYKNECQVWRWLFFGWAYFPSNGGKK